MPELIALFTDFGAQGPYLGEVRTVLATQAPEIPVIDLVSEAPAADPRAAAYLLAAVAAHMPKGTLFLAVVDPGVGTERRGLIVQTQNHWYVGPDNGLLAPVVRRAKDCQAWCIDWQPERLAPSFHGRDLFAPVAARVARGETVPGERLNAGELVGSDWPCDLPEIIFIDHYGNVFTGLQAAKINTESILIANGQRIQHALVFGAMPEGGIFWYENSSGLVEIAVNRGRADQALGLKVGDSVCIERISGE